MMDYPYPEAAHAASELDDDEPVQQPMTPAEAVIACVIWVLSTVGVVSLVAIVWGRMQ